MAVQAVRQKIYELEVLERQQQLQRTSLPEMRMRAAARLAGHSNEPAASARAAAMPAARSTVPATSTSASDIRARAAARLTAHGSRSPTPGASDVQARAAARLAAMRGGRQSPAAGYQPQHQLSPRTQQDSTWSVHDEVVFKLPPEDLDDDMFCVLDWPAAAASSVAETMYSLSPRRENSPLRFLEPVMDQFACMRRRDYPSLENPSGDKQSI